MKQHYRYLVLALAMALVLIGLYYVLPSKRVAIEQLPLTQRIPRIFPDYDQTVIPPNIAPLNFVVNEAGARYAVRIHSARGEPIEIVTRTPRIVIPFDPWKQMLRLNPGEQIHLDVAVKAKKGGWSRFETLTNTIAREEIDGYLVYRLLKPLYSIYMTMGIYQRNLQDFEESVVLDNRTFGRGCVNCHTFLNCRTDSMALHIRSKAGGKPMLVARNGDVATVAKPAGYLSWHPSGRMLAFSANKLSMFFHTVGETRDVFDSDSDLGVYMVNSNTVTMPASVSVPDRLETWPGWSPDGRHLYFCSAPKLPIERFREIRYDLMRVGYDPESNTWGEPETILSAAATRQSITEPRVSPDGRFLLFCMSEYGNFPVYYKSSDLYVMDLETRQHRRLEINSDQPESWHSWSSNSRWIVFSSKRRDGLFARPYFSYVDESGVFHKPLLLPQKDPAFYDSFIQTYNVPELVSERVRVKPSDLSQAVVAPRHLLEPQAETRHEEPYQSPTQSSLRGSDR